MKLTAKSRATKTAAAQSIQSALSAGLEKIATAGAYPIMNEAMRLAPLKTGTLRRSIHVLTTELTPTRAVVSVGPDVPYGRRLEFGFVGKDSLGRNYHQGPRPYMRPAFETQKEAARAAMLDVAQQIVKGGA